MECFFCGSNKLTHFDEHFTRCNECRSIYTYHLQNTGCNHVSDERIPTVYVPSDVTTDKAFIDYTGADMLCSVCNKKVSADGW